MQQLKEVVIEITGKCNMNCMHCGSNCGHIAAKDELTADEWNDVLAQLSEMGVEKVVFSGGEPTLKAGFEKILLATSNLGMKVGFISNGLNVFSGPLQDLMRQKRLFAVGLSIDGLKYTHNMVRRNKNGWHQLMQNISILQDAGTQVCAVTTLHKLNYLDIPKLARVLECMEIDSWQLQLAMPSGRMNDQLDLLITEKEFQEICNQIMSLRFSLPNLNIQAADCFGIAPEGDIRTGGWSGCTAGIYSMAIDARGFVLPCLSMQASERQENCRARPVREIWENSTMFDFNRKFQLSSVEGRCQGCELLGDCRGGCGSQSYSYYGHFHSSPFCFYRSFCSDK